MIFGVKLIITSTGNANFSDQKSLSKKILYYENEINFFKEKLKNKEFINKAPSKIINQHKSSIQLRT